MNDSQSRRRFLMDASYGAVAATGIAGFANRAMGEGEEDQPGNDHAQVIDLGLTPALGTHEAVIIPRDNLVFAAFPATDSNGADGTGLIEFSGCKKWKLSGGTDDASAAVDTDSLALCGTFEVLNSSWAQSNSTGSEDADNKLRHFVLTFFGLHEGIAHRGKNLEFLAVGIHAELLPKGPFEDVIEYIELLNAGS